MFGVTVFLLSFILNACRWVMHLLLPAPPPFPIILYLACFIHLSAWLLDTFGFDTSKTSCGRPRFPCRASTLNPSLLSWTHFQSAIQTPCTLRHPFLFPYPHRAFPPSDFPKYCPVLTPTSVSLLFCVCLWEKGLAGNILLRVVVFTAWVDGVSPVFGGLIFIQCWRLGLYSVSKRKYDSSSKQLNSEWIWWPNPFITWELHRSKFWWVLWRGLWRHTVLN